MGLNMFRPDYRTLAIVTLGVFFPSHVFAYIDPGTSGMISQILYVLFYGVLAAFFYSLNSIKQYLAQVKSFLAKKFGGR